MPLAWQMSLHLSFGETPAYLGVHSTVGSFPKEAFENSLWASHCSSRKVFPEKRMVRRMLPVSTFSLRPRFWVLKVSVTHRRSPDSPQCCRTCNALVCLHSTFLRFWVLGCHILSLYTELLHRRSANTLPRAPMSPSFHEQESKWRYKYHC